MGDANLIWKPGPCKKVFSASIVDVYEVESTSPDGRQKGTYYRVKPKDGVTVIPLLKTGAGSFFVMVRQWRHGAGTVTTEFPSGIVEEGESLEKAAARELREETGYRAASLERLAAVWQNPAIMCNTCNFFAAEGLELAGEAEPDSDEYIERVLVPKEKLLAEIGTGEFAHEITAAALFFYMRSRAGSGTAG